ncbi:MAG: DVU0298 family protein [Candidatus Omnitrophota bacterium]
MKREILDCLAGCDWDGIRRLAEKRKTILSLLFARTFDADKEIRWRAVEALAAAASVWVKKDPAYVRDFCRRLLWALNDESGNIAWMAPQALGAILAENHEALPEFLAPLLGVLELEEENSVKENFAILGALWAVNRIGPIHSSFAAQAAERIRPYLQSLHPEIRSLAEEGMRRFAKSSDE